MDARARGSVGMQKAGGKYIFGLLQIVWFIWLGIVMFRTRPSEESQTQSVSSR